MILSSTQLSLVFPMPRVLWICFLICMAIPMGCDSDEHFRPKWQASWLLMEDSSGTVEVLRVDEQGMLRAPWSAIALAYNGDRLYTLEVGRLVVRDPQTGEELDRWEVPGSDHVDLDLGLETVIVSAEDSSLYFRELKGDSWQRIRLAGPGGALSAKSDRIYAQVGEHSYLKIQEQARSSRDSFVVAGAFRSMQPDGGFFTFLYTQDSSGVYWTRLNYHNATVNPLNARLNVDETWINPLIQRTYGREYLGNLERRDSCVVQVPGLCGEAFWPIWQSAEILRWQGDSLFRHDLNTGSQIAAYASRPGQPRDGVNHFAPD